MKLGKIILAIIAILIILIIGLAATSTVLFIAEDTSEEGPGCDMAAVWNLSSGFDWIYPGSSHNAQGQTLHNIHLNNPDNPYQAAKEIMEYTYGISPNIVVTLDNDGAEMIFGGDIVGDIRDYDWGNGMSRGPAAEAAMSDYSINYFEIPLAFITGHLKIHFI